jgi:hypothetical protein
MIAANHLERPLFDPANRLARLGPVVHQIAETKKQIVRLLNGFKRRQIGMNVRNNCNSHITSLHPAGFAPFHRFRPVRLAKHSAFKDRELIRRA